MTALAAVFFALPNAKGLASLAGLPSFALFFTAFLPAYMSTPSTLLFQCLQQLSCRKSYRVILRFDQAELEESFRLAKYGLKISGE